MTLEFGIAYQDFIVSWCSETERRISESLPVARGG